MQRCKPFKLISYNMARDSSVMATLCLACSSSLPPRLWKQVQQRKRDNSSGDASTTGSGSSELLFLTRCCGRPICPSCLTSNPRLARYDPCLACLGGIGAIESGKPRGSLVGRESHHVASNIDGAVRDEDVFVVGDEDEDEEVSEVYHGEARGSEVPSATAPPNNCPSEATGPPKSNVVCVDIIQKPDGEPPDSNQTDPQGRYYIQPDDTLFGISLRLGVDVSCYHRICHLGLGILLVLRFVSQARTLCKLNDLPPSTLRTTPHLLHTRTFLVLPQSHSQHAMIAGKASPEEEVQRTREGAKVTFQRVTKEMDEGIVQAYVALAEDDDSDLDVTSLKVEGEKKRSQQDTGRTQLTLEERAMNRYFDDEEWELGERAQGRGVHIERLK